MATKTTAKNEMKIFREEQHKVKSFLDAYDRSNKSSIFSVGKAMKYIPRARLLKIINAKTDEELVESFKALTKVEIESFRDSGLYLSEAVL